MLTVEEIIKTVTPILQQYNVKEAKLFGSYAKGCATEYSDIDLYVDSGLKGWYFYGLLGDVYDAFPIQVDLIDKQMVTPNGPLDIEIRKTGMEIPL